MTTPVYDTVAYVAANQLAVSNVAGDSFVAEFAPGLRLRADCGTDGVRLGTVAAASFDAATGRTVVTTTMDGGAALTANLAAVLHGNDLPESLCAHATLHALGGRDALPAASTGVSGLVSLASTAETQAGASAAKAVTPAGLAASAKGLIAANTTIYVATTGSDVTGTGASGAPYASIARALSSIAGKLIASGATVTIQVADGTYTINSAIVIDHPDADKVKILGNTSSGQALSVASIDTASKKFVVSGDYTGTVGLAPGDIFQVLNGTTANQGSYSVANRTYTGSNTEIVVNETIASSTPSGASITTLPSNGCILYFSGGSYGFSLYRGINTIDGLKIVGTTTTGYSPALIFNSCRGVLGPKLIVTNFARGVQIDTGGYAAIYGTYHKLAIGVIANRAFAQLYSKTLVSSCDTGLFAYKLSEITAPAANYIMLNVATAASPAISMTVSGNVGSFVTPSA